MTRGDFGHNPGGDFGHLGFVPLAQRGLNQSLRGGRFDRNANSVRVFACSFCMMRLM